MAVGIARRRSIARHFRGIDVVHYPFPVPVPRFPAVVVIHDLQHLDLPNLFSRQRRLYRRVAYDRAVIAPTPCWCRAPSSAAPGLARARPLAG